MDEMQRLARLIVEALDEAAATDDDAERARSLADARDFVDTLTRLIDASGP